MKRGELHTASNARCQGQERTPQNPDRGKHRALAVRGAVPSGPHFFRDAPGDV